MKSFFRRLKYSENPDYFPLTQTFDLPFTLRPTDTQPSFAIVILKKSNLPNKLRPFTSCVIGRFVEFIIGCDHDLVQMTCSKYYFGPANTHNCSISIYLSHTGVLVRKTIVITFESYAAGKTEQLIFLQEKNNLTF
jgi:hypothetical protein